MKIQLSWTIMTLLLHPLFFRTSWKSVIDWKKKHYWLNIDWKQSGSGKNKNKNKNKDANDTANVYIFKISSAWCMMVMVIGVVRVYNKHDLVLYHNINSSMKMGSGSFTSIAVWKWDPVYRRYYSFHSFFPIFPFSHSPICFPARPLQSTAYGTGLLDYQSLDSINNAAHYQSLVFSDRSSRPHSTPGIYLWINRHCHRHRFCFDFNSCSNLLLL